MRRDKSGRNSKHSFVLPLEFLTRSDILSNIMRTFVYTQVCLFIYACLRGILRYRQIKYNTQRKKLKRRTKTKSFSVISDICDEWLIIIDDTNLHGFRNTEQKKFRIKTRCRSFQLMNVCRPLPGERLQNFWVMNRIKMTNKSNLHQSFTGSGNVPPQSSLYLWKSMNYYSSFVYAVGWITPVTNYTYFMQILCSPFR